ncbi:DNA helicase [Erythrobacter jejuensis]|uniref:DNA helicase n=2 Tax=Parerythrobacter jejuensis TaxID=795812 RepID=A0A845ATG2_9SPHN|nr:DNA helicase [Parerythrobacter jejuensis]
MKLSAPIYQLKRHAKLMAREANLPLHQAQDRIARREGFVSWSQLAAAAAKALPGGLLGKMEAGDLVILAARPGHGKTLCALNLLVEATREDRRAVLFTLDLTQEQALDRLEEMGDEKLATSVELETSDDIDADFIIAAMASAPRNSVAVIDYLQLLDEQRSKPAINDQLGKLRAFACERGIILIFISQIDRSFEEGSEQMPRIADVRSPNALPTEVFSKGLFLHEGKAFLETLN